MKELFEKGKKIEDRERRPQRPLGVLSDYLVKIFPERLIGVGSGRRAFFGNRY